MKRKSSKAIATSKKSAELPTFLDHVYELRRRLFWIVATILVASGAAYPFIDQVLYVATAPLGGQQLYYLTPIGGFSFSLKICFYVGIMFAVPVIMYHIYRFLEPLMGSKLRRSASFYVGLSTTLAIAGVLFAYYLALPGALRFLTGVDLSNIQAMLTADSYLTFVMTYLLGGAVVFQIPLFLIVINTMTPLNPSQLFKANRFVIVAAFIAAAVISPTPDVMNQTIFALPMIIMYELGIIMIWIKNSAAKRDSKKAQYFKANSVVKDEFRRQPMDIDNPCKTSNYMAVQSRVASDAPMVMKATKRPVDSIAQGRILIKNTDVLATQRPARTSLSAPMQRRLKVPPRTVDGFVSRKAQQSTEIS